MDLRILKEIPAEPLKIFSCNHDGIEEDSTSSTFTVTTNLENQENSNEEAEGILIKKFSFLILNI